MTLQLIRRWRNPGFPVIIYELASFIGVAYQKAMTSSTISNAFKKTGIFPFGRDIFSQIDFLPNSATDRPDPGNQNLYILEQDVDNENRDDKDSNPNDEKDIEANLNSSQHGIVKK